MSLTSKQKMIINISALSILAIIIIVGTIWPTILKIQKITKDTYDLRLILEKKYQQSLNAHLTKNRVEQVKKEIITFPNYLFHAQNTLNLIQMLETIAKNNHVNQNIISSNLDKVTTQNKVNINLNISGKYLDVLNYIYSLEASNYFITNEEIRLTPNYSQSGQTNNLTNLNLTISLYVNR